MASEKFDQLKKALPADVRPVFEEMVRDYQSFALEETGRPFASFNVLARMVRLGWRKTAEPLAEEE